MLMEYGFTKDQIPDPLRDYAVQAWLIGQYLIKVQLLRARGVARRST